MKSWPRSRVRTSPSVKKSSSSPEWTRRTAKKFYIERANFRASFMLDRREQDAQRGPRGPEVTEGVEVGVDVEEGAVRGGGRGGRGGGFGRQGGDFKRKRDGDNNNNRGSREDGAPPSIVPRRPRLRSKTSFVLLSAPQRHTARTSGNITSNVYCTYCKILTFLSEAHCIFHFFHRYMSFPIRLHQSSNLCKSLVIDRWRLLSMCSR